VFVSSAAAFVCMPGYIAYTPSKVAVRAFADTLRQELLLYGTIEQYAVYCAFPGTFISASFLAEQASKPELTKIMEGSDIEIEKIRQKTDSAAMISWRIIHGLERGHFFVTTDWEMVLILNNI